MQLTQLKIFHQDMREKRITVGVFHFSYNNTESTVLFFPNPTGWHLTFCKATVGETLDVPIRNYSIKNLDNETLNQFYNYFQLKRGKGNFSMNDFSITLNKRIPSSASMIKNSERAILSKIQNVEEKEKPYFLTLKNWHKINAQNQKIIGHRTEKNLEKTRILYPNIYHIIKKFDISVVYTSRENFSDSEIDAFIRRELGSY